MGYFILFYDLDKVDLTDIYSFTNRIVLYTIIFIIFTIGIFYFLYISNYKKFITLTNRKLELQVRKRTKELRKEKEYIQTILDINPTIIMVTNGFNIIDANKRFFEFFEFSSIKEFMKKHECICEYFNTLDDKEFPKDKIIDGMNWAKYLANNNDTVHSIVLTKNENEYYFHIYAKYLHNDTEDILLTMHNITEEKKKEKVLYNQSKLAQMGEMIGNIAHQWRQPLSVITTGVTGMQIQKRYNSLTDEIFNDTCNIINENAQYLSSTIDDFKNFIQGDREKVLFSIKNNIESFLNLVDAPAKYNNINIILDFDEDVEINGYPNELSQCFINIFNNAKDILVTLQIEEKYIFISTSMKNNTIVIKFKDNAGGIPKDIIEKIFEPYFTTKHKSQGTGLGLHMTYNFITTGMNGQIGVNNVKYTYNNKKYKGAEFYIVILIL